MEIYEIIKIKTLAKLLKLPVTTINNWRYGRCKVPAEVETKFKKIEEFINATFRN